MTFVVSMAEADAGRHRLGGKAGALAALYQAGFEVPPWLAVLPRSAREDLEFVPEAQAELEAAAEALFAAGATVAVRSSAAGEDGAAHSFAGQLESFLFVTRDQLLDRVKRVWRSGFSERVVAYRKEHGLSMPPPVPAVLVQEMIDAEASGVAFSADPVSGRRAVCVVSAVHGLGTALVSGAESADTWRVNLSGQVTERDVVCKTFADRRDTQATEGVSARALDPALFEKPVLADRDILLVAALARRTERYFGRPQDIEWAMTGGRLWLLQARPITVLGAVADPDGAREIWDNSNIAESYGGITLPLTFSFARRAYEEVYRQFCRVMAVPEPRIEAHANVFRNMLGLIRGRVYYNLLNWYRVLALLPGFQTNRQFMETMMGVKESLPAEVVNELAAKPVGRVRDIADLVRSVAGLLIAWARISTEIERFHQLLDDTLEGDRPDLAAARPDQLAAYYRRLEARLLPYWRAPLVNDFFAMIFFGVLRRLAVNWCGREAESLQNDLLCGQGGMISAEPAKRVLEMARTAAGDAELCAAVASGVPRRIEQALVSRPKFKQLYEGYLEKFGERCMEELKLESLTLIDNPALLARSVAALAEGVRDKPAEDAADFRTGAERLVAERLSGHPLRRLVFGFVLRNARERVRDRENLRFERTRVFGRVRSIFAELGKRLWALNELDDARDVFYLEVNEVLGLVEGTATTVNVRRLVEARKAEYEEYGRAPAPPDRFETRGIMFRGTRFEASEAAHSGEAPELTGLGCCPGIVRGRARLVRDPKDAAVIRGEVLVAERTDPGWIMLFPLASGLIVERGSLLSHSAIVARELKLPAVVGAGGAMSRIRTGDLVELDGRTGAIRILERDHG